MQIHIHSYGAYLHIVDDMFEIKVKVDKDLQKTYLPAQDVTSIWLSDGVAVSTNAVQLAIQNNIDVIFMQRGGFPAGRVWHSKLGSTSKIRKLQLQASLGEKGLAYTKQWIRGKLENQAAFLENLAKRRRKHSAYLKEKAGKIRTTATKVAELQAEKVETVGATIRGLEGTAGRLYFAALSYVLPTTYQFTGRSSRPAFDVFNALLNYAYGILYSRVEKTLIVAGLDPYVGFLHRDDYNHKSLVFDFIESFRSYADETVFKLCSTKKVNKSHWKEISHGVGLSKEGKVLLVTHFNIYLDGEKVRYNGKNMSRSRIIQSRAYRTAQEMLEKDLVDFKMYEEREF